jgi:hypothetical protein
MVIRLHAFTHDSDDNDSPLALPLTYLITFKCYET